MKRDELLALVSEEQILLKALGLEAWPKGNISSPFVEDKEPSFSLFRTTKGANPGRPRWKCHSSGKTGDAFQIVADLGDLDPKADFPAVVAAAAAMFGLNGSGPGSAPRRPAPAQVATSKPAEPVPAPEPPKFKEWTAAGLAYFARYGIGPELLARYGVKELDSMRFPNGEAFKVFPGNFAFVYNLPGGHFEAYAPEQHYTNAAGQAGSTKKFFHKSGAPEEFVWGLDILRGTARSRDLFICGSKKDALSLLARGFAAVALSSETQAITPAMIESFEQVADRLFVVFDNDPGLNAGQIAAAKALEAWPQLANIVLPRVADGLKMDAAEFWAVKLGKDQGLQEFAEARETAWNELLSRQSGGKTLIDQIESFIIDRFDVRRNLVNHEYEIRRKGFKAWKPLNDAELLRQMLKENIKASGEILAVILKSEFTPDYDPFLEYFESLTWDGQDHLGTFSRFLAFKYKADKAVFDRYFTKWMIRAVRTALGVKENKQATIFLTEAQNSGKSTLCRWFCPPALTDYFQESIPQDKDGLIALTSNILINLDELQGISKQDLNSLKSKFSTAFVKVRAPYEAKPKNAPRRCSFLGSTNEGGFLRDSENVRWLVWELADMEPIDWAYSNETPDQLWAQAYTLYKRGALPDMTPAELAENEKRNSRYFVQTPEMLELLRLFKPSTKEAVRSQKPFCRALTATEIINEIVGAGSSFKLSAAAMGQALDALKFVKMRDTLGRHLRCVERLSEIEQAEKALAPDLEPTAEDHLRRLKVRFRSFKLNPTQEARVEFHDLLKETGAALALIEDLTEEEGDLYLSIKAQFQEM